jgi:tetratricopeptide (TPR) repeat protein
MVKSKWAFLIILLFFSNIIRSQDDSEENVTAEEYTEEQLLEERKFLSFEDNFLNAVQQRSIENYDRAIEDLILCEKVYPENVAMFHEFAKNYLSKNNFSQALIYSEKALNIKPDNFWVKSIKRDILLKMNNLSEALVVQKELCVLNRSEASNLLNIYYKMQDRENGKKIIEEAEKNVIFIENLNFYKKFFLQEIKTDSTAEGTEPNPIQPEIIIVKNDLDSIINHLKLLESQKNFQELLSESAKSLELNSTQPMLYLFKGKAYNQLKKSKEAIEILENGLDFVFDNNELMKQFYNELVIAYQKEGNITKVNHYKQLVQKLK